ncbi:MAG: 30S ribosomal protein S12 methylthiotransferase RimO [Verrucomicrobia bacterium]|nr:30S ribosomal protein S12 methylthiotransferase RimO [Verrucomicrobiota bacterium]
MKATVHLVSLGCAKNLVDSEVMIGTLLKAGHAIANDPANADVVIVNTCGFVASAKRESINVILEISRRRLLRPGQKLLVAGCMAQRYANELRKEIPEVSAFIGINEVPRIHEIIASLDLPPNGAPEAAVSPVIAPRNLVSRRPAYLYDFATPRYQLTPSHYAYLKIGDGCNHPCAFCSIPLMRGRHRSRTLEDVEAEARALVAGGARELLLISQDTTWFGRDLGLEHGLSRLLARLNSIEGDFWIRVLYTHPAHWDQRLMDVMAASPKVCRYVDMPLQHVDDALLLRMRRKNTAAQMEDIISRLRSTIPTIAIRTTFLVGFPGETEAQFQRLCDFVERTRFERLGVFEYSREDGTAAGRMERQIPVKVKKERRRRLMAIQRRISTKLMASQVGRTLRVLVDHDGKKSVGRTERDAPEIDGRVLLRGGGWRRGEFQQARIIASTAYDLVGRRQFGG